MIVDYCEVAEIVEDILSTSQDRSACEVSGTIPGYHFVLRVSTPLELGGRRYSTSTYPPGLQQTGFDGCIRNVRHNGWVMFFLIVVFIFR